MLVKSYIFNALLDFGLSEGEARTYLAAQAILGADAQELKNRVKCSTAGIYKIVSALLRKGFLETPAHSYPSQYFAVPLEKIAGQFSNRSRRLQRISERLKDLGKLGSLQTETEVYEDTALTDYYLNIPYSIGENRIWCVGAFGAVKNFLGVEVEKEFIAQRVKKGIHCDAVIFDESDDSKTIAGTSKSEKRDTKFIANDHYPLEFTYLYDDTIVTFFRDSDQKVQVLKTKSPELARAKLLQYQLLWKSTAR
ncbi:MAG: helix-turn-helix domain-containing protein [Candidatus Peregrinibacteria bacterium]